jgi:hypothetical protein
MVEFSGLCSTHHQQFTKQFLYAQIHGFFFVEVSRFLLCSASKLVYHVNHASKDMLPPNIGLSVPHYFVAINWASHPSFLDKTTTHLQPHSGINDISDTI